MGAFCKLPDSNHNQRHCRIFKPGLYDALRQGKLDQKTGKRRKNDERRYTQELNIFQFEVVLIPVWIDKHWTIVAIDIVKMKQKYLDTLYEGGSNVLFQINRWPREQWDWLYTDPPPEWKTIPSTHGTTLRQRDDCSCGLYQPMFMWRIANGKATEVVEH